MKSIYLIAIVFCNAFALLAQFPQYSDSPKWFVKNHQDNLLEQFYFTKDTFMCGKQYSVLNRFTYQDRHVIKGLVREEGDKVFFRYTTSANDKEYLLYDFSLTKGDTVYCGYSLIYSEMPPVQYSDTTLFYVVNVDSVTLLGKKHKRLTLKYDSSPLFGAGMNSEMQWIEGIGSLAHPFYAFFDWGSKSTWFDLACVDLAGALIYKNSALNLSCDITGGISIDEAPKHALMVHLNSTCDQLEISLPDGVDNACVIELADVNGCVVCNFGAFEKSPISLKLPNLNAGFYLLVIRQANSVITQKLMVR